MANNPNKIAEGLNFMDYTSNMSNAWGGLKFPESIAADVWGGSHCLYFSGKDFGGNSLDPKTFGGGGFGPRGLSGTFEPLSPIYGLDGSPSILYNQQDLLRYWIAPNSGGFWDPNGIYFPLDTIIASPWESGYSRIKPFSYLYLGHDANTPKLHTKFGLGKDNRRTPGNLGGPIPCSGMNPFMNSSYFNNSIISVTNVSILDVISEGPIEGLVTGNVSYSLSGKSAGDIGYTNATIQGFFPTGLSATNALISTDAPETRSIFWNDIPLANDRGYLNFQFVNYKFNYGEPNLHTIHNPKILLYEDRHHWDGYQVDKFKYPIPIQTSRQISEKLRGASIYEGSTSGLYFPLRYPIYNTDIEAIKVNFKIEGLFWNPITGSNAGDIDTDTMKVFVHLYRLYKDGTTAYASMELAAHDDPYMFSSDVLPLQGKITSPMMVHYTCMLRSHADNGLFFELHPNQIGWLLKIEKPTQEMVGNYEKNTIYVDSITQIYSDRFTLPSTACIWSNYDARYFGSVPERTYRVKLLKVKIPTNYDPLKKTYDGNWDGTFKLAWTDNPAWCYYDLITNNRYGLGKYIDSSLVDKWTLYEVSKYCDTLVPDGLGGLEPRFTCNVLINSKEEAHKVLDDMASIFNGLTYYSAGQIFVSQDSPKEPIYLFNNSNVIQGEFTYSDSSKKVRRSVALVRYNDATNNYKPALEYVEDRDSLQKFGIRETEVTAFGCTRPNQARRLGRWFLKSENLETETVEFKVGIEGSFLKPGDIIQILDENRKNNIYAGRTYEFSSTSATLDLPTGQLYNLTGGQANNIIKISFLNPTYTLERGTDLGNLYITGFDANSSGVSGLNSSFFRKSQIDYLHINNPFNYFGAGTNNYKDFIKVTFPSGIPTLGKSFPQNTVWSIEVSGYNTSLNARSQINNPSNLVYPGYYLEATLDKPKPYRIVNIQEVESRIFSVTALEFVAQKYSDIETGAALVSVPGKVPIPSAPQLYGGIIYRDTQTGDDSYTYNNALFKPTLYTSTQTNGINSIWYWIKAQSDSGNVSRYVIYRNSGSNFESDPPYQSQLLAVQTNETIGRSGVVLDPLDTEGYAVNVLLPYYFTPQNTGSYYLRVYAENVLGERSPYSGIVIHLTGQGTFSQDQLDDYNIQ